MAPNLVQAAEKVMGLGATRMVLHLSLKCKLGLLIASLGDHQPYLLF